MMVEKTHHMKKVNGSKPSKQVANGSMWIRQVAKFPPGEWVVLELYRDLSRSILIDSKLDVVSSES